MENKEDDRYADARDKMYDAVDHFDHHESPKIRRKQMEATKDYGQGVPDRLEQLKDQNHHLKRHQGELDTEIKLIST